MSDQNQDEALMRGRHDAIGAAREWFLANGFDIDGYDAIAASGYGSGGIVVPINSLTQAIIVSVVASVGRELLDLRKDRMLTQAEFDDIYRRVRIAFVGENWMPPGTCGPSRT